VKVHKNADPKLHPHEKAREYTRAVRAVKLERLFSKPFVGAMDDHADGVYCCATSPKSLVAFVSGAADGECIIWDLASQKKLWSVLAHSGFVRGLTVSNDGGHFFSCGDDRTLKQWRMVANDGLALEDAEAGVGMGRRARAAMSVGASDNGSMATAGSAVPPVQSWSTKSMFMSVDAHWSEAMVATSSSVVEVWDYGARRSDPVHLLVGRRHDHVRAVEPRGTGAARQHGQRPCDDPLRHPGRHTPAQGHPGHDRQRRGVEPP
jgi:WD repeat and SOF domain-containing protein 1